jgi:ribose transport system permease protein
MVRCSGSHPAHTPEIVSKTVPEGTASASWTFPLAVLIVLIVGGLIGLLNGVLTFRIQGQSLIMTLGVGFAVVGAAQIITSIGSEFAGNVLGQVPSWLRNMASIAGTTFGIPLPPVVVVWLIASVAIILMMSRTLFGRSFYAVGGNRRAAARIRISEFRIWATAYVVSGAMSAVTGMILLGFSGGRKAEEGNGASHARRRRHGFLAN